MPRFRKRTVAAARSNDVQGYAIDQNADNNPSDPLQGHLHGGMPAAAGRDPGQVVTQVGTDLAALIRPLGRFLPF
jgi:hypothetical protein